MEDELDDKIIYQTYVSHMKLLSRFAWGLQLNFNVTPFAYLTHVWNLLKMYALKPEIVIFGSLLLIMIIYLQAVDMWSRTLLGRLRFSLAQTGRSKVQGIGVYHSSEVEKSSWHLKSGPVAVYAVQGRRAKMEDRFVINDNINGTGVMLLAIFDGHGGEFAANYAKEKLIPNLYNKVKNIKDIISGKKSNFEDTATCKQEENKKEPEKPKTPNLQDRRKSFKKTSSITDECIKTGREITDAELLTKLDNLQRTVTREVRSNQVSIIKEIPAESYYDKNGNIDYGKLITDEVLAADSRLLEITKKNMDVAGTTALISILEGSQLYVANVGDSRGVMCDSKGNVIPLSFDHKPQQMREQKRIKEAGGFITFNGVWRVAGILATSRAMGDYPLKDKKLVIADPDILTFNLDDHKPSFLILATDGLWDIFSNEEAVAFIKERLNESDYGAKSITLQSYYRGSLDNITVMIINFGAILSQ